MTAPLKTIPTPVFQNFEEKSDPSQVVSRVTLLRAAMKKAGVDAYLLPRGDRFRGENVPAKDQRLAWLSSFTGSAGMAVISQEKAALFVDGRYTLQAPAQTDTNIFDVVEMTQAGTSPQLCDYVPTPGKLGFDPWVHAPREIDAIRKMLGDQIELVPTANLIDEVWTQDRPATQQHPIEFLGDNRAGVDREKKLAELRAQMSKENADAIVFTMPDSVCWLFNIRGRDVPQTPFVLAYAIVPASGKPTIYLDTTKLDDQTRTQAQGFDFADISQIDSALEALATAGQSIWIDPATCPVAVLNLIEQHDTIIVRKPDPISVPKAQKNDAELSGMRDAHKRDGVAMVKFLSWLDANALTQELTEIDLVAQLEAFRREDETLVDISFETISGAGPNGAIIHYRVTDKTNRKLAPGDFMLVDSGGQYLSGTTDITRTIAIGDVSAEQKDRYTRVLKGMISLSKLHFPEGVTGAQIDILARQHLWEAGLNYAHGTGHGVGAFLSVHEGPISISPRSTAPLKRGNILSNEPGFYKAGEYGIRIENLVHIEAAPTGENYCAFETLTLAPIDITPIDLTIFTNQDRMWLNAYHTHVLAEIGPLVSGDDKTWLEKATRPI